MSVFDIKPTTIVGIKRLASNISKRKGVTHSVGLDQAAVCAGYANYKNALRTLNSSAIVAPSPHFSIFISVFGGIQAQRNAALRSSRCHYRNRLTGLSTPGGINTFAASGISGVWQMITSYAKQVSNGEISRLRKAVGLPAHSNSWPQRA
ncbi:MAG: hypothetical protein KJ947_04280 [Alphaproteobacteria bacterium]|jgi:hypothetical protein|nr:hypothetical protein [Alphaproteobacteria bacterium]MBU1548781.1 hypothetical protein [Alphaproteobacteria bacterium]MBU2335607.1 hypothetical protein [Alphaproteobacteria bacterium]MBU2390998.1 hypothetical protein [Alphaproteobacteria bacterium]